MALPPHPLGVRPGANELLEGPSPLRSAGLGTLRVLTDALLLDVLEFLPGDALFLLSAASRALYAFTAHEDLWRTLSLRELQCAEYAGRWRFAHGWRATYAAARGSAFHAQRAGGAAAHARGLYSDLLHHAFRCASAPLDPAWLAFDNLPRECGAALGAADFAARYEAPNLPCVLRGGAAALWPGQAQGAWSAGALAAAHGATRFHCAGFSLPLSAFLAYAAASTEDNPLYLFDKEFVRRAPALGRYTPPPAFGADLLALLGEGARPDWRWLIIGGAKSGSVFHQDPNGTSAWNACLQGRKRWLLIPPDMTPPGVWAAADGSEVCVPISVMEWLLQFYSWHAKARDRRNAAVSAGAGAGVGAPAGGKRTRAGDPRALAASASASAAPLQRVYEGTVEAGDIVYVPRGWWHLVCNLDPINVAVTHNFCSPAGLPIVLAFLRDKPFAVSGVPEAQAATLHARFLAVLREQRPDLVPPASAPAEGGSAAAPRWSQLVSSASKDTFSLAATWGAKE